jgi:ribosomal protein S17E
MRLKHLILLSMLLSLVAACQAQSSGTSDLPDVFKKSIPVEMKDNLKLVEVKNRCDECEPWRYIDYYSNKSNEPIKREKITVLAGYGAMYAYPGTHYFANTKIEQSTPGAYEKDKKIVTDAIKHEYNRKKERIAGYLMENPKLKEKMEPFRAKGKDYIDLEESTYKGFEYISYTENVIGLTGNTISQIHIFAPKREIIVTAYLLRQEKAKFSNIEEFLKLRSDFIEGYIEFLSTNSGG